MPLALTTDGVMVRLRPTDHPQYRWSAPLGITPLGGRAAPPERLRCALGREHASSSVTEQQPPPMITAAAAAEGDADGVGTPEAAQQRPGSPPSAAVAAAAAAARPRAQTPDLAPAPLGGVGTDGGSAAGGGDGIASASSSEYAPWDPGWFAPAPPHQHAFGGAFHCCALLQPTAAAAAVHATDTAAAAAAAAAAASTPAENAATSTVTSPNSATGSAAAAATRAASPSIDGAPAGLAEDSGGGSAAAVTAAAAATTTTQAAVHRRTHSGDHKHKRTPSDGAGGGVAATPVSRKVRGARGGKELRLLEPCELLISPPLQVENALLCDCKIEVRNDGGGGGGGSGGGGGGGGGARGGGGGQQGGGGGAAATATATGGGERWRGTLQRGGQLVWHAADLALPTMMRVQLPRSTWSGVVAVSPGAPPSRITVVRPGGARQAVQHFAISLEHRRLPTGGNVVALYCQYWMVNLTGLPLEFAPWRAKLGGVAYAKDADPAAAAAAAAAASTAATAAAAAAAASSNTATADGGGGSGQSAAADTQVAERAAALFGEGRAESDAGHYARAAELLEASHGLSGSAAALVSAANMHAKLGDTSRAVEMYTRALSLGSATPKVVEAVHKKFAKLNLPIPAAAAAEPPAAAAPPAAATLGEEAAGPPREAAASVAAVAAAPSAAAEAARSPPVTTEPDGASALAVAPAAAPERASSSAAAAAVTAPSATPEEPPPLGAIVRLGGATVASDDVDTSEALSEDSSRPREAETDTRERADDSTPWPAGIRDALARHRGPGGEDEAAAMQVARLLEAAAAAQARGGVEEGVAAAAGAGGGTGDKGEGEGGDGGNGGAGPTAEELEAALHHSQLGLQANQRGDASAALDHFVAAALLLPRLTSLLSVANMQLKLLRPLLAIPLYTFVLNHAEDGARGTAKVAPQMPPTGRLCSPPRPAAMPTSTHRSRCVLLTMQARASSRWRGASSTRRPPPPSRSTRGS